MGKKLTKYYMNLQTNLPNVSNVSTMNWLCLGVNPAFLQALRGASWRSSWIQRALESVSAVFTWGKSLKNVMKSYSYMFWYDVLQICSALIYVDIMCIYIYIHMYIYIYMYVYTYIYILFFKNMAVFVYSITPNSRESIHPRDGLKLVRADGQGLRGVLQQQLQTGGKNLRVPWRRGNFRLSGAPTKWSNELDGIIVTMWFIYGYYLVNIGLICG